MKKCFLLFLLMGFVLSVSGYAVAAENSALDKAAVETAISNAQGMVNDLAAAKGTLSAEDVRTAHKLGNDIRKANRLLARATFYKDAGNLRAANAKVQRVMRMVQKAQEEL